MIRPQQHNTIRRTVKLKRLRLFLGAASAVILCSSCEEVPPYAQQPRIAAGYPAGPPGWWDDAGASGSPKIVVHIGEQKAYFYKGKNLVGETTVSTGKPGFSTPPGRYQVLSKSPDHVSSIFGNYVDDYGNVVRFNIDARKDRQPRGTHFDGAEMPYAMFFRGGYAMHQGYVPPYAASHGCIRLPRGMASRFFENASVGTPVTVKE
jgi:lipoprotein-anchoring transpeptidase ErfK/SrfK